MDDTNVSGLWNCPRVNYSNETRALIQMMMRESKLTSFQQRQINNQIQRGGTLPMVCNPSSSAPKPQPQPQPRSQVSKGPVLLARSQRRSAEKCSAGDNYSREKFIPRATRDLEKEKHRLQSIFSTGQDQPHTSPSHPQPVERPEERERDRFQEVLDEIEERRKFLEEMTALGKGRHYHPIINSQISQKIRELELIDGRRSEGLRTQEVKDRHGHTEEE
ncbi:UPF0193 protein EVG1 isoform X2 [Hoplias malabaricus]|uniref:UPF0193 protein EVG1 isoform X2 n=1 Tax=Hoplias malabaricus TaxID=27720 RepID=UPI00346197C3